MNMCVIYLTLRILCTQLIFIKYFMYDYHSVRIGSVVKMTQSLPLRGCFFFFFFLLEAKLSLGSPSHTPNTFIITLLQILKNYFKI